MTPKDRFLAEICHDVSAWSAGLGDLDGERPALDDALGPILALAVHESRASVVVTDAELDEPGPRVVYANPAFEAMTGHRAADMIGRSPRLLQGPATSRAVLDRLRHDLSIGQRFEGEAVNYRADGTPFIMAWRIDGVRDRDGAITHYVAMQHDVTAERLRNHHEHRLVRELQHSLVPAVPERVGFLEVAARYRHADGELPIGGDWYDAIDCDGHVDLVVGDVTGHGVDAVAAMGRLRWSIHALLSRGATPEEAASAASDLIAETSEYATLAIARVTPDGVVRYLTCGAVPIAVLGDDRGPALHRTPQPLLGLLDRHTYATDRFTLRPGDRLALFTDGLTDNGRIDDLGLLERLRAVDGAWSPSAIADELCARSTRLDDTAVLAAAMHGG